ncbi:MAG: DNA polymerase I [Clostridiales bacterium]|nr:DNA polymerase I [Clostridiales bacterium]
MDKLVLIDGNSLINRAFYAIGPLTDKSGQPTNAVFGFVNMLIKVISDIKPKYMLVAFDVHAKTFRHKMFDDYKGTRKPMPEDLRPQIPLLKKVLETMGVSTFELAGFEADDIIGTLAKRYKGETVILTGDKDSFQLVDESTSVYFTKRGITDTEIYSFDNFTEKTGITPSQVIELKALMGDSSDNIPGIPGVGEKTALSLVQKYGNLENIYQNLQDFKGKQLEKIENGKDSAYLSRTLATINTLVEIPIKIEDATFSFPFDEKVKRLFSDLEFRGILKRSELFLESEAQDEVNLTNVEIKQIKNSEELHGVLQGKDFSFSISGDFNIYIGNGVEYAIKIKESFFDDGFDFYEALNLLKPYFEDENVTITAYSRKRLDDLLFEQDIILKAKVIDVDILRYLCDFSGKEESFENTLYYYNLNEKTPAYSLSVLAERFIKQVKEENIEELYYDVELPLSKILTDIERQGFKVDISALEKVGDEYRKELSSILARIKEFAGEDVNPNSPKQLASLLFEKLGLKHGKKNKSGSYSTNAEQLEELQNEHPIIPLILRHRTIQKLLSTYVDAIKALAVKDNGLVHTSFNQTLTQTGRLSSKEPNLQNIPIRDEEGSKLRKFFIPRSENGVLIDADYSQIELRLLAHFSKCQKLIDAYNRGDDIHSITASQVFNVPLDSVTSDMRRKAKAVNFGIIYGISEYGLSKNIKCSVKEASEYIKKYFETYPEVKEYMNSNVSYAREHGYVSTLLGRRRYIKEINAQNFQLRSFGERAAMNMPLQGSSADVIKIAMVKVYERLKKECPSAKLILQVHDELIIDALEKDSEIASKILKEEMENACQLSVPLTVECKIGKTWYEAK